MEACAYAVSSPWRALGTRSDADLAWETELLLHLDHAGLTVPVPIPTMDGRLFADGMVVMTYVDGGPPETEADWRRVAETLRKLHRLTQGWPQRPGWRSSTDLDHRRHRRTYRSQRHAARGVARCRAAWARIVGRPTSVTHGDPNSRNIRMTADRVGLIDWDEAHVDVSDLDLDLPHNPAGLDATDFDAITQASAAWEATPYAGTTTTPSDDWPRSGRSEQGYGLSRGSACPRRASARVMIAPNRPGRVWAF